MTIRKESIIEVLEDYELCKDFSSQCLDKLNLHEDYRKQADLVIAEQELRNSEMLDELNFQKRQKTIIIPVISVLLGIAAGMIYQQNK